MACVFAYVYFLSCSSFWSPLFLTFTSVQMACTLHIHSFIHSLVLSTYSQSYMHNTHTHLHWLAS